MGGLCVRQKGKPKNDNHMSKAKMAIEEGVEKNLSLSLKETDDLFKQVKIILTGGSADIDMPMVPSTIAEDAIAKPDSKWSILSPTLSPKSDIGARRPSSPQLPGPYHGNRRASGTPSHMPSFIEKMGTQKRSRSPLGRLFGQDTSPKASPSPRASPDVQVQRIMHAEI